MLEQQNLLLRPWATSAGGLGSRAILDPASGAPLGFACWRAAAGPCWRRWLAPAALAVHESDDEPLVFTVQRVWGLTPRWEVRDADGHYVGMLREQRLHDRYDRGLAAIERSPDRSTARFRGPDGRELGALSRSGDTTELTFTPSVDGQPFVKMVLLAAALLRW